ncbi:unnamed protein product, partial [marine sediment metagenome]
HETKPQGDLWHQFRDVPVYSVLPADRPDDH